MVMEFQEIHKGFPIFVVWQPIFAILSRDSSSRKESKGIQGEFGIGLLSFWTVGHNLEYDQLRC